MGSADGDDGGGGGRDSIGGGGGAAVGGRGMSMITAKDVLDRASDFPALKLTEAVAQELADELNNLRLDPVIAYWILEDELDCREIEEREYWQAEGREAAAFQDWSYGRDYE